MTKTNLNINQLLMEVHKQGQENAKEASIRTGVPLVVEINGKIEYVEPEFKYIRVPINFQLEEIKKK